MKFLPKDPEHRKAFLLGICDGYLWGILCACLIALMAFALLGCSLDDRLTHKQLVDTQEIKTLPDGTYELISTTGLEWRETFTNRHDAWVRREQIAWHLQYR